MPSNETLIIIWAIFSTVAGIFAWYAKIQWSKEFKEAKEAEIKAKEAQIAHMKKLQRRFFRAYPRRADHLY